MTHSPDVPIVDAVPASHALSGSQIAQAAALLILGTVLSRLLGLVRDAVLASIFGAGTAFEAFIAASRPPETLFYVVAGGALGSAFIPTFISYLESSRRAQAWRMASAVITLMTLIVAALAVLVMLFAQPIVQSILAPDFPPEKQALTIHLVRIMMLTPILFSVSGLLMGILNANQRFLLPAIAPALYNIGIILGAVILSPSLGIYGPTLGMVIGALLHLLVQVPGLVALRPSLRPVLDLREPGVIEVLRLMGPRVLGLAIVQVNFWINTRLGSAMVEGSVAALARAWTVLMLPQGMIAQSVANAVFPTFSIQVARDERDRLRDTLGQVLRTVLFVSIPASVGLILLRLPIVQLLYERGQFTPEDSQATAWALLFYGLGLIAHSLVEIVTRAFYAMHDTRTPVIVGGGAMILNVILSLILIGVVGEPESLVRGPFAGLALANTLATTLESVLLLLLILPRVGGLEGKRMMLSMFKAGIASAGMGLVLWVVDPIIEILGQYLGPLMAIAAGGLVFGALAWLLRSEEARLLVTSVRRRLSYAREG